MGRLKGIILLILPLLMALSLQRNTVWRDGEMLWGDAVAKGPGMARPHVNLGKAYIEAGRFREAIAESRRALEINAGLPRAYYNVGWAHHSLEAHEWVLAEQSPNERKTGLEDLRRGIDLGWQTLGARYGAAARLESQTSLTNHGTGGANSDGR